jgi:hypothetical protein
MEVELDSGYKEIDFDYNTDIDSPESVIDEFKNEFYISKDVC